MREPIHDNEEVGMNWLFTGARNYPLLSAEEEQSIDLKKWQAIEQLQHLFIANEHYRWLLNQWAEKLLHNPPVLEDFEVKEHYFLLRREQQDLLARGKKRASLLKFSEYISGATNKSRDLKAIVALQLPAGLVAGLAELLAAQEAPRGVAAALISWNQSWATTVLDKQMAANQDILGSIQQNLDQYYSARGQLVNHNLRLVFSISGRMVNRGVSYRDLIQNGVLGLIRAAEKFEHQKGYRFSTYAFNWINQSVRRAIEDLGGIVRYPSGINDQISRMHRERMLHLDQTGFEPKVKTLARKLNIETDQLQRLRQVGNLSVPLDSRPVGDTEGLALADTLADTSAVSTPARAEQESLNRCLMQKIEILEPLEQRIVIQRWGLDQRMPLTRAQIAEQLHVSTEWVRQLEGSALAKLRNDRGMAQVYQDHINTDN